MESREIKKLRIRFMAIALVSVVIVMLFIGISAGTLMVIYSRNQINTSLDLVVRNYREAVLKGINDDPLPRAVDEIFKDNTFPVDPSESFAGKPFYGFSLLRSGLIQGTRIFTVEFNQDEEAVQIHVMNLDDLSDEEAVNLATSAAATKDKRGRFGVYFFRNDELPNGNTLTVCLNNQNAIYLMLALFSFTLLVCVVGFFITFVLVRVFSMRAIKPAIENSERQKKFITNASHELKTPLAVIKANTEFTEITSGESEWTKSTLNQVDRMNGLIQNLVMITRQAEQDTEVETDCNLSKIALETVTPFESLAKRRGLVLSEEFEPNVTLLFDASAARMLISVLTDNAIKYCDENGRVIIKLTSGKRKNTALIVVSNSYKDGEKKDYKRFFDRFYRSDESHHSDNENAGGYGIGLSVAESIANRHSGSIDVSWKDGMITFTVTLCGGKGI